MPALISQTSGPSLADSQLPVGIFAWPSTRFVQIGTGIFNTGLHLVLFWLQYLPLSLGIVYLFGVFALILRRHSKTDERAWWILSLAAIIGFLLIVQFIYSTFWNNTFGWRAVLVPVMLLMVWAAVILSDVFAYQKNRLFNNYYGSSLLSWLRPGLLVFAMFALSIGLMSTVKIARFPIPQQIDPAELAQRQGFLRQYTAWQRVRELTPPAARVQVNPDGYLQLTPWPATLPYALFADRKIAYANVEYATVFAYRYDAEQNAQQYRLVQNIFSAEPHQDNLYTLRDRLKVHTLLIDQFDPVWDYRERIAESGAYRLAYAADDFQIYVATTTAKLPPNDQSIP